MKINKIDVSAKSAFFKPLPKPLKEGFIDMPISDEIKIEMVKRKNVERILREERAHLHIPRTYR